jgi:hypothetical protein
MKSIHLFIAITALLLSAASSTFAADWKVNNPGPLLAQMGQMDVTKAQPRVMGLYEQGWNEGVDRGDANAGKVGWFFAGFGNVPLLWLPWVVEPRRPAKPSIMAEEEYNSGFKNGYRAGWKNAHKTFYIAGMIVSSAGATAAILASK